MELGRVSQQELTFVSLQLPTNHSYPLFCHISYGSLIDFYTYIMQCTSYSSDNNILYTFSAFIQVYTTYKQFFFFIILPRFLPYFSLLVQLYNSPYSNFLLPPRCQNLLGPRCEIVKRKALKGWGGEVCRTVWRNDPISSLPFLCLTLPCQNHEGSSLLANHAHFVLHDLFATPFPCNDAEKRHLIKNKKLSKSRKFVTLKCRGK